MTYTALDLDGLIAVSGAGLSTGVVAAGVVATDSSVQTIGDEMRVRADGVGRGVAGWPGLSWARALSGGKGLS